MAGRSADGSNLMVANVASSGYQAGKFDCHVRCGRQGFKMLTPRLEHSVSDVGLCAMIQRETYRWQVSDSFDDGGKLLPRLVGSSGPAGDDAEQPLSHPAVRAVAQIDRPACSRRRPTVS